MGPVATTKSQTARCCVPEIMVFLHSHGVGTARAVRIFKTYGADAVQVMTENGFVRVTAGRQRVAQHAHPQAISSREGAPLGQCGRASLLVTWRVIRWRS